MWQLPPQHMPEGNLRGRRPGFSFFSVSVGVGAQRLARQHIGAQSAFLATVSKEAE